MTGAAPDRPLVFALSPCRRLVASIARLQRGSARLGRFPNGELHARVETPVAGRECMIVGSISPPDTRIAQVTLLAHAMRRAGARTVTAVLPYLAYARQDRADAGEGLGLAWAGGLLRASGVDRVVTVDVHSEAAASLLAMPLTSLRPHTVLAAALPAAWTSEEVTFVAPDEGAIERCRALANTLSSPRPIAFLTKRRSGAGIVHTELTGELGRRALIVDDILDTGATLLSCCRWLTERGVAETAVVVTHAVLTGSAWLDLWSAGMRRLWVTDTIPGARAHAGGAEVVSVAPLLAPVLQGWATNSSRGDRLMPLASGPRSAAGHTNRG
jgi:ribose-phosphate pyrophosphokinase